jgi:hypothetical protein
MGGKVVVKMNCGAQLRTASTPSEPNPWRATRLDQQLLEMREITVPPDFLLPT